MEKIIDDVDIPPVAVLFAPHHGRDSGRVPEEWLDKMSPRIIVVGEAPSEHLHYYPDYHTITQNSAGDLVFACDSSMIHVFTSYDYAADFLDDESMSYEGLYYAGTLNL
jgi:hypothetical protein